MFEKLATSYSSEQEIELGTQTLGEPPVLGDYIQGHPRNSELLQKTLAELGLKSDSIKSTDLAYIRNLRELIEQSSDEQTKKYLQVFADLEEIVASFDIAVKEYEELEDKVFENLTLNGEKFLNRDINRLIIKLRDEDGLWEDIDENTIISSFDNEWQRLYQVVRNEDPHSTFSWRRKISEDILSIFSNNKSESIVSDDEEPADNESDTEVYHSDYDDDTLIRVEYDRESIYAQLDSYFAVDNLDQRFIPTTIDLLFQAQELEKAHIEAFVDDPSETIDWYREENQREKETHEIRDVSYKNILRSYVEERLKPRLNTVFDELKYQSVMDAWDNNDADYTDYSEIALPTELHKKFYRESNKNKADTHYCENIQVWDELLLAISKDCYAEYVGNDTFHPLEKTSSGQYEIISVKALLERTGLKGYPLTNDGVGEYRSLMDLRVLASLKETFGVDIRDLSIKEQYFFLGYLQRVTPGSAELMKRFTSLYGVDGIRTFLSLERGDETLGDHIVAFGQYDEVAGTVFKYYGELLNSSEKAEALVQEAGCEGEHCVQLAEQVRENIINRAQKDLETAVRAHDPSEVAARIETYVADAKVYVALLQEAVQQPLESIPAAEISDEDKEQIRVLSARNYVEESEDFQGIIRSGLESAFESGNTRFYIERDDSGKVIFCDRFDDKVDPYNGRTIKYFGSVNAEPAFNGIGRVRITETLEQELANGETMFAHCDPENAVSSLYIEHGFVATGTVSPAGKFSFEIWRSNGSSEQLQTKSLSTAELLDQLENQSESAEYKIRKVKSGDQFPELGEGKYLTRYFRHNGEYYAVFESAPAALLAEFVPPQEQKEAA